MAGRIQSWQTHMWPRNLLFAVVCLFGFGMLATNILLQDRVPTPRSFEPGRFGNLTNVSAPAKPTAPQNDWQATLQKLNAEFRDKWEQNELQATPRADDLTL